jgi:PRC-barrel domain
VVHRLSRIRGFHVHATDSAIGHVDDLLVDEALHRVCYLVVDTSNWLGGKWVAISPTSVRRVDWVERTVHVAMSRDEIKQSPSMEEADVPPHEMAPGFVII